MTSVSGAASDGPPRPLNVGDIVICQHDLLGEWVAAQITGIDPAWKKAGVLELDWSGPEPFTVDDLGTVAPLRLTHHSWNGRLSHTNCDWLLPRSYRVIGSMPLLHDRRANAYARRWQVGDQLSRQRAWDRGEHDWRDPTALKLSPGELAQALADGAPIRTEIRGLQANGVSEVDGGRLVEVFPNLKSLTLGGSLGQLANAGDLNELHLLRELFMADLFGMTKADCVLPEEVPDLECLDLHSVPHEYAGAMRTRWRPQVANGTSVDISKARKPEWVRDNLDNPLRDWDGRKHITAARFKKAVAQFKKTRREVLAVLAPQQDDSSFARLADLGREYALAFNRLDGGSPFIETEEREELFAALQTVVTEREQSLGRSLSAERTALLVGVDEARNW
jgi:hypothetical protein